MLSTEDNELLCRVGPGTPMGTLMRQYWIPGALSSELPESDGAPMRVRLLGEDLIAFRDSSGAGRRDPEQLPAPRRLAVLRPQRGRGAALRLPRLEVRRRPAPASTCPTSRPRATSRPKSGRPRTRRRSAAASSGSTWGRTGRATAVCPTSSRTCCREGAVARSSIFQRECNWMQALEGDIDTGHTVFLHTGAT